MYFMSLLKEVEKIGFPERAIMRDGNLLFNILESALNGCQIIRQQACCEPNKFLLIEGLPGKKPLVASNKLLDSPSTLPCIPQRI